jgi:hypothetical protein
MERSLRDRKRSQMRVATLSLPVPPSPFGSDATKKIGSRSRKQGKGTRWIGIDGAIASDAILKTRE